MSLQFNCPYCQLLMSADPRYAGGQVQCPSCHQVFMIGGPVPVVPVAQARSVLPAAPAPARPTGPAKPVAPPVQRPGQPRSSAAAKGSSDGSGFAKAMVAGVILLGVGVIYGGVWLIGKFEEKAATVSQFDLPPEVKARDAARAAQLQKEKAEQEAEEAKGRAETLDFLTQYVSNNDTKVAAELMKEMDAISVELQAIRADADASNDPKDLHVFWTRSLEEHAAKNNVLHHWLGGRPASIIATALWGDATSPKPRGQVADFLMGGNYASTGTGFFISSDGWLLTNQHVVGDATEVDIRGEDGVIRKAKVLKADAEADVALLKAESAPAHWLHFTAEEVQMGADVCTVGFPNADIQGVEPKYTAGTVSSLSGIRDDHDNYQTTVPVQPGNSGGPLVEMKSGNVVGIVASILRHEAGAENVSYAIKGGVVQRVLSAVPEAAGAMSGPASSPRGADTVALAANVRASIVLVLVK